MAGLAVGVPIGDNNVGTGVYAPAREDRRPRGPLAHNTVHAPEAHTPVLEGMRTARGERGRDRAADADLLQVSHQQRDGCAGLPPGGCRTVAVGPFGCLVGGRRERRRLFGFLLFAAGAFVSS